jgi:hypothetical protein
VGVKRGEGGDVPFDVGDIASRHAENGGGAAQPDAACLVEEPEPAGEGVRVTCNGVLWQQRFQQPGQQRSVPFSELGVHAGDGDLPRVDAWVRVLPYPFVSSSANIEFDVISRS